MSKVDIVYTCQMKFNKQILSKIICSDNMKTLFLQVDRLNQTFIETKSLVLLRCSAKGHNTKLVFSSS